MKSTFWRERPQCRKVICKIMAEHSQHPTLEQIASGKIEYVEDGQHHGHYFSQGLRCQARKMLAEIGESG